MQGIRVIKGYNNDVGLELTSKTGAPVQIVWDGTTLKVNNIDIRHDLVSKRKADLTVIDNNIEIDFNDLNEFVGTNRLSISADSAISFVNSSSATFVTFKVDITNLATITFPLGSISGDARIVSRVFTPEENGKYCVSIYITPEDYDIVITSTPAI